MGNSCHPRPSAVDSRTAEVDKAEMVDFCSLLNRPAYSLRARWVFPGSAPPVRDGVLNVAGGRIVSVTSDAEMPDLLELADVALLPGLVNAHTHLEFSDLESPLGRPGIRLPDWIRRVIADRRGRAGGPAGAILQGLRESAAAGVTAVGEIATAGWNLMDDASTVGVTAFHESIALSPEVIDASLERARDFLSAARGDLPYRAALSPHAPYTVHPELCARLMELASQEDVPVAMHLAESPEEIELLAAGSGGLVEMLSELGFWREGAIARGTRPLDYLRVLSRAPRALVIHGNYLQADELDFLAQHADRMSLVYCPRTHAYFGHAPYHSIADLQRLGVNVCLGTDSRASNPDLSLWNELKFVARRYPELSGAAILALGTTAGATALGIDAACGHLLPGMRADYCLAKLPHDASTDPYDSLWSDESEIVASVAAGKVLHCAPGFADFAT